MSSSGRTLRSSRWFTGDGIPAFQQRVAMKVQGFADDDFLGRPVIGICNNQSEFTRCHLHFTQLIERVKHGVWRAGGFPLEFPTMTMGADISLPNGISFMHRNLLAMEVEQTIRAYPMDGVVLLGSCDETIPGMLMAVASLDFPAVMLPGGPGLNGHWRGECVGSSTDCHRLNADLRGGKLSRQDWHDLETHIERSPGHCTTMGTASTMACIAEALGMAPLGSAAIPAVDANRLHMATFAGERAVELVRSDTRPSHILTASAFENAIRMLATTAGSTNAVIHLLALAKRVGVDLVLADFDRISRETPVLLNLKPSGDYLMEDFFYAGGVPALMKELSPLLDLEAQTVGGVTLREGVKDAEVADSKVIASLDKPFQAEGGIAVLRGNLAPAGAILKQTAATPGLLTHTGRAVVFEDHDDMLDRLEDPALDVSPDDILLLKGGGPKGAPGMPEWGSIPIPSKLLRAGVRDMVRVSDSRMSGTAFGTIVLHVTPESAIGGPLAAVQTGDQVCLDIRTRGLSVLIEDRELQRRMHEWRPPASRAERGYPSLYVDHVLQADQGCDFDFLLPDAAEAKTFDSGVGAPSALISRVRD